MYSTSEYPRKLPGLDGIWEYAPGVFYNCNGLDDTACYNIALELAEDPDAAQADFGGSDELVIDIYKAPPVAWWKYLAFGVLGLIAVAAVSKG